MGGSWRPPPPSACDQRAVIHVQLALCPSGSINYPTVNKSLIINGTGLPGPISMPYIMQVCRGEKKTVRHQRTCVIKGIGWGKQKGGVGGDKNQLGMPRARLQHGKPFSDRQTHKAPLISAAPLDPSEINRWEKRVPSSIR